MQYEVIRQFTGDRVYAPGEVVDAAGWRTLDKLVEQRYLRPVPIAGVERPAVQPSSRPATRTGKE